MLDEVQHVDEQRSLFDWANDSASLGDQVDVVEQLLTPDQIYESADQRINLLKEDRRIERKSPGIHQPQLGEYFSMRWTPLSRPKKSIPSQCPAKHPLP